MNFHQIMATKNLCYRNSYRKKPTGIMVHSTGANNPWLKRYVQPDDGLIGVNRYSNSFNQPTPGGRKVCPNAVIGKLANGSVATYQILPWDMAGWHSASGKNGSADDMGYIGFEICQDDLTDANYFNKVYQEAIDLCVYLCQKYNIKPDKRHLICHSEGHTMGIASGHADVMHWFPRFGKSMDTFRAAVQKQLNAEQNNNKPTMPPTPSQRPSKPSQTPGVYNQAQTYYKRLEDIPEWYKPTIQKLVDSGDLRGSDGNLNVSETFCRIMVVLERKNII